VYTAFAVQAYEQTSMSLLTRKGSKETGVKLNEKNHPFFMDQKLNSRVPQWYVECSRQIAEQLLTSHKDEGNVLMRPSQQNGYALSIRTVSENGQSKFNHYMVKRNSQGKFWLDIDNPHSPVPTLSQVVDLFIQLAGPSNHRKFGCMPAASQSRSAAVSPTTSPPVRPGAIGADLFAPVPSIAQHSQRPPSLNDYVDDVNPRARGPRSSCGDYIHPNLADVNQPRQQAQGQQYLTRRANDSDTPDYLTLTDKSDGYVIQPRQQAQEQQYITIRASTSDTPDYLTLTDKSDGYLSMYSDDEDDTNKVSDYMNLTKENTASVDSAAVKPKVKLSDYVNVADELAICSQSLTLGAPPTVRPATMSEADYLVLTELDAVDADMPQHLAPLPPVQAAKPPSSVHRGHLVHAASLDLQARHKASSHRLQTSPSF
jgi:hypothetical protein